MQGNDIKRNRGLWVRGFAALGAVLTVAAGGSASAAPTETVLHSFSGSDGAQPIAGLLADGNGNLYGTTAKGGASGNGVVFKLAPGGTYTVLYSFTGGSAGRFPQAGLIADSSGNLYGTTQFGGAMGNGVVFKLAPGGTETVLYSFCHLPGCTDGAYPQAGLIADSSGNLFGTTPYGGTSNDGVVFKLTSGGTYTVLYSFSGGGDGAFPGAPLIADGSGNLYGTTAAGGASNDGVVFKLTPGGTETVLHSFTGSDGAGPFAGLISDSNGNLYGTTAAGGAPGYGVVFKLTPGGTYTVLYSFTGGSDGANPAFGLTADNSGNLYGTTPSGGASGCGASGCGVVFKLTSGGTETVLYTFTGLGDGAFPGSGLTADSSGDLFGTTFAGGASGNGTVFELPVAPTPFLAFSGVLNIAFGSAPLPSLAFGSGFTLSSTAPAFYPETQPVTLQAGNFIITIPPGSFTNYAPGSWYFQGFIGGAGLQAFIAPMGTMRYAFYAEAWNAPSLTGITNPVPVTLTIGPNTGTISVDAYITNGAAAAAHRR